MPGSTINAAEVDSMGFSTNFLPTTTLYAFQSVVPTQDMYYSNIAPALIPQQYVNYIDGDFQARLLAMQEAQRVTYRQLNLNTSSGSGGPVQFELERNQESYFRSFNNRSMEYTNVITIVGILACGYIILNLI